MKTESEDGQVVGEAPADKPRLTIVALLSALIGVLLSVVAIGGFFSYRQNQALRKEIVAAKNELTQKSRILDETKAEIGALSRQLYALREHSIARSNGDKRGRPDLPQNAGGPAAGSAPSVAPATASQPVPATVVPAASVKTKKPAARSPGQSCEIAGKPPAEQASILQRCVGAMEGQKPPGRAGK